MAGNRKLTTILFADAHNYGAQMAADETVALARLNSCRDLMNAQFDTHQGRLINTWGDAVIAEFASVVEAVRCAVAIQNEIEEKNASIPENQKMRFRIGINLGDVMIDGDNVYGEGVNMAARLESNAKPGGIMVSKSVHEFAARHLAVAFDYAGVQKTKVGEAQIEAYEVRLGGSNQPAEDFEQPAEDNDPKPASHSDTARGDVQSLTTRFSTWWAAQNRKVRMSVSMIAVFFTINLLFSGLADPWFIYPSIPFAAILFFSLRKSGADQE